jgi:hypothetical protein
MRICKLNVDIIISGSACSPVGVHSQAWSTSGMDASMDARMDASMSRSISRCDYVCAGISTRGCDVRGLLWMLLHMLVCRRISLYGCGYMDTDADADTDTDTDTDMDTDTDTDTDTVRYGYGYGTESL